MLKQSISKRLEGASNVLIAGAGGGYDVLGAIPLGLALADSGASVHYANTSFAVLERLAGASPDPEAEDLYRVGPDAATEDAYCPEAWLARWLTKRSGTETAVWAFRKTGVQPLQSA